MLKLETLPMQSEQVQSAWKRDTMRKLSDSLIVRGQKSFFKDNLAVWQCQQRSVPEQDIWPAVTRFRMWKIKLDDKESKYTETSVRECSLENKLRIIKLIKKKISLSKRNRLLANHYERSNTI